MHKKKITINLCFYGRLYKKYNDYNSQAGETILFSRTTHDNVTHTTLSIYDEI